MRISKFFVAGFVGIVAGCGSDLPPGGPNPTIDTCTPATCALLGASCGTVADGCGQTLECGSCTTGTCGGGGIPNVCGEGTCKPLTCNDQPLFSCGQASDGCGGMLSCECESAQESCVSGRCEAPCVATVTSCSGLCGAVSNGCGQTLDCGGCTGNQVCNTIAHRCEAQCTPAFSAADCGEKCGSFDNGCGTTIECATNACGANRTCNLVTHECNQTCVPKTCADQGASCGSVSDGCGNTIECGGCNGDQTCNTVTRVCQSVCTPRSCADQGASCGSVSDGCGNTIECGACTDLNEVCGAVTPNACSECPPAQHRCASGCCPWTLVTLDGTKADNNHVGAFSVMRAGTDGRLRAVYGDVSRRNLKYIEGIDEGAPPTVASIPGIAGEGLFPSLALGQGALPAIAYFDPQHGDLRYVEARARDTNGSLVWREPVTLDAGRDGAVVGEFTTIVLKDGLHPRIAYRDRTNGDLLAIAGTRQQDGSVVWTQPVSLDATGDVGFFATAVIDARPPATAQGNLRVVYADATQGKLKIAYNVGTTARRSVIDDVVANRAFASLAIDGSGNLHVSYHDGTGDTLKYARGVIQSDSAIAWTIETVDTDHAGWFTSIAVDEDGRPRIAYGQRFAESLWRIRYAMRDGTGQWTTMTVEQNSPFVAGFPSLVMVGGNRMDARVVFYDMTAGALRYAKW